MMRGRTAFLMVLFTGVFAGGSASAQFNESRGQNAPTESAQEDYLTDEGEKKTRTVRRRPTADAFGNAVGSQFDLAVDGAFDGQTVAVLHLYTGEGFDFSLPKAALGEKGFSVYRWINTAPSPKVLKEGLDKACQLWIISGSQRHLSDAHVKIIKDFFDSGRGVYIWGDNQPFYTDANVVAKALFNGEMLGNLPGTKTVTVRKGQQKVGLMPNHDITTGLEHLYEGITLATLQPNDALDPLLYGSAGNLVAAIYDHKGRRAVLDGGFTRLYINWDTAGTARYVKNAASWLVNHERFGDRVLADKFRKK
jgi:hypothetical protein